jgi:hypothetical protein
MGIAAGMAVAITVVLLAIARVSGFAESALDTFWRPVLAGTGEVLLSVGNLESGRSMPPGTGAGMDLRVLPVMGFHTSPNQAVLLSDAAAASRFAGMLTARGRSYKIVSQPEAAFADLESGPAILIGLQHIAWTARITGGHRFSVDAAVPGKLFIRDRNDPSQTGWSQDLAAPHLQATKDYGLVCRIIDPKTKRMVVAVAGISPFGAQAAAELLTSPIEIRKLGSVLRQGRESKNIEAVIATDVIRGKPGHPTVIATHCW